MRRFVWTLVPSVLALAACTAGSEEGTTPLGPKQQYEVPPPFRDDPGTTYQTPPSTYQAPPGMGCLACGHFRCMGTVEGQSIDVVIGLAPDPSGGCSSKGTVFACDGTLVDTTGMAPEIVGHWSRAGGGFVATASGANSPSDRIVCEPTADPVTTTTPQPTPQPGGDVDAG